jgi:hypothetical protein
MNWIRTDRSRRLTNPVTNIRTPDSANSGRLDKPAYSWRDEGVAPPIVPAERWP